MKDEKSVLIDKSLHKLLKETSKDTGITMKNIVEKGIELYLKRIKRLNEEN
jgi:hypothetical protein